MSVRVRPWWIGLVALLAVALIAFGTGRLSVAGSAPVDIVAPRGGTGTLDGVSYRLVELTVAGSLPAATTTATAPAGTVLVRAVVEQSVDVPPAGSLLCTIAVADTAGRVWSEDDDPSTARLTSAEKAAPTMCTPTTTHPLTPGTVRRIVTYRVVPAWAAGDLLVHVRGSSSAQRLVLSR